MVHRLVNTRLFGKVITHMCSSCGSYLLIWLFASNNTVKPYSRNNIFENCLYRQLDILGVLKSGQMKINHIWPEYVKVGPGAVRDIWRCGVGTHQYISRSHLSPSGVQSPGVGWDVGRVHKGGGVGQPIHLASAPDHQWLLR